MNLRTLLPLGMLLAATALAGCFDDGPDGTTYQEMGFDGENWPRLDGVTLTILDHGAFGAFDDAAKRFEELTGAKVQQIEANDAGSALNRAVLEAGDPTFDIIYGIDNILFTKALEEEIFEPYTPILWERVAPEHVFFDHVVVGSTPVPGSWPATPVDHGYIAVNWDPTHDALREAPIDDLGSVAARADLFVTEDPRTSTPGLGFLLATIATYGDTPDGSGWQTYWTELFERGVLVTSGWTEAYEQHFSGGYGPDYGGLGDRPIVTSYTTSPAYEAFFGRNESALARVVTADQATFHQIETMGIARGTDNLAAAQAWIEFTLTADFQGLVAPSMAVYPVITGVTAAETFGDHDPEPGTFQPADFDYAEIGANVERWVQAWTDLCETHDCA